MYLGAWVPGTHSLKYHVYLDTVAFVVSSCDKVSAVAGYNQRVPERAFIFLAFLGGGWGLFLSFFAFNHKIRKTNFLAKIVGAILARIVIYSIYI